YRADRRVARALNTGAHGAALNPRCPSISHVDGVTAVHGQLRAVDVARTVGRKEYDGIRHLLHRAPAARHDPPLRARSVEESLLRLIVLARGILGPRLAPLRGDQAGNH